LNNQEIYRAFSEGNRQILIFQTPLWLDAVVGKNNWEVAISHKGKNITGALPYVTSKRLGFFQVTIPILTYYLGPIFFYPNDLNEDNKISFQRKTLLELISQLPKTDRFVTQTDFNFDYWLPFYWNGFKQTTRYTYILSTQRDLETIFNTFKPTLKKAINKASETFRISEGEIINTLYELHKEDYNSKGLKTAFTQRELDKIDVKIKNENLRLILEATDAKNEVIAAIYLLKDAQYFHYMFGAVDSKNRSTGVMSQLIWAAIQEAKKQNLGFNFGGSMNKNIEQYFSGFKATLKPYMRISKISNSLLKPFTYFGH
jgi:predicted GNAT family N-acyltransferase